MKTSKELEDALNAVYKDTINAIVEIIKSHGDTEAPLMLDNEYRAKGDEGFDDYGIGDYHVCVTGCTDEVMYEVYLTKVSINEVFINEGRYPLEFEGVDGGFNDVDNDFFDIPSERTYINILNILEMYYGNRDRK